MPRNKFNTFSFNNFKPFNEKMQTFSRKPITLIYGANSVGKSSLIQVILYYEYLARLDISQRQKHRGYNMVDLYTTYFAGDELDLGGFLSFVHQESSDEYIRSIKYGYALRTEDALAGFFPVTYNKIKELDKKGVFEYVEHIKNDPDIDLPELVMRRFKKYKLKRKRLYITAAAKYIANTTFHTLGFKYTRDNFVEVNELKNFNSYDVDHTFDLAIKSKLSLQDITKRRDKKPLDLLDLFLLFYLDNTTFRGKYLSIVEKCGGDKIDEELCNEIMDINLYKSILNIQSITKETVIQYDENNLINGCLFIDNEKAFDINSRNGRVLTVNFILSNNFISNMLKYLSFKPSEHQKRENILSIEVRRGKVNTFFSGDYGDYLIGPDAQSFVTADLIEAFTVHLLQNFIQTKKQNLQYIGPLRYVPSRGEYYELAADNKEKNSKQKKFNNNITLYDYAKRMAKQYTKYYPRSSKLSKLLFFVYYSIISLPIVIRALFYNISVDISVNDLLNDLTPQKKNKRSTTNALTSEKMWQDLLSSEELQKKVNQWLSDEKKLKTPYQIVPIEYKRELSFFQKIFSRKKDKDSVEVIPELLDIKKDITVSIKSMGLGISQVLPVIISSISAKNTKIFLEQPELHLHPAVQAELADEFIRSYKENNNEFMIETHSEHLLLRIMKRMRHTAEGRIDKDNTLALTPDDICLLYVDSDGENTFVNELELDDDGTLLDPWPNGFFEEGHRERFD